MKINFCIFTYRRRSSNLRPELDGLFLSVGDTKLEQDYIQMYLGELTPMQVIHQVF